MKKYWKNVMCVLLCLGLCICGGCGQKAAEPSAEALTWQEQYDLGVRYLSEGKYAEAILAFTAAIAIDPKQVLAYQKAAEAYTAMGDADAAIAILKQGVEATGDQGLSDALAELEAEPAPGSDAPQESGTPQPSAEAQGPNSSPAPDASPAPAAPQGSDASQASNGPQETPAASQEPETPSSPEPSAEPGAVTIDFDPVALLGQNISVITDKYGEPTDDWGTVWRWCADDYSYDFQIELFEDKTIRSVNCGWGAPAILGVKAGDSADAAQAALSAVGEVLTRDAGNGQVNYFTNTWGEPTYDFATMNGSVIYVSVYAFVQG